MHLLTVSTPQAVGAVELRPGKYMVDDINGAEMLAREVGTLAYHGNNLSFDDDEVRPFNTVLNCATHDTVMGITESRIDLNGQSVVICRSGGIGDLLLCTPSLHAIKQRWSSCRLHIACFDVFAPIFDHNPDVDIAGFYPLSVDVWNKATVRVWLENAIEKGYDGRHKPAIDIFAERIGIAPLIDRKVRYFVSPEEKATALARFPKTGRKRIGYHMEASAACRTYPPKNAGKLGAILGHKGYELVLFGSPAKPEKSPDRPNLIDLTMQQPHLSFRESAAVLSTCNALIAPDSSILHLAGALDIPAVGLFGAFEWQLRTGYAEKTFSIQGRCSAGPCFHHARNGETFPKDGPCQKSGMCDAMDEITPERVIAKMESLL